MSVPSTACAVHEDRTARGTCERCGRFCCAACLDRTPRCPECRQRALDELPSLAVRSKHAAWGLWANSALIALSVLLWAGQVVLGESELLDSSEVVAALLSELASVSTMVLLLRWFHSAMRHGLARGAKLTVTSPSQGVIAWLIPILNFTMPFTLLRQLLQHAGQSTRGVTAWQVLWLLGSGGSLCSLVGFPGSLPLVLSLATNAMLFVAGFVSAAVVRRLRYA